MLTLEHNSESSLGRALDSLLGLTLSITILVEIPWPWSPHNSNAGAPRSTDIYAYMRVFCVLQVAYTSLDSDILQTREV